MLRMLYLFETVSKIILIAALCLYPAAGFCSKTVKKIEKTKNKAGTVSREIKKNRKQVNTFTRKENSILDSLNRTGMALNKARKQISRCRSELETLGKESETAQKAYRELTEEIQVGQAYAARRMTALYKLNRLGTLHMLASADSVSNFFQRKTALERIIGYDERLLQTLSEKKTELDRLQAELDARKQKKLSIEADYKKQVQAISRKKAKKNRLLADIRKKKSLTLASIQSLKASASELDRKLRSLESLRKKELEARRKKKLDARRKKELDAKKKQGDKKTETVSLPEEFPSGKFAALKGLLKMPVRGKVVSSFGKYKNKEFNVVNFRSGIDIKAKKGTPIRAVCSGQVLYSGWFKGYGNMMIIDHGDHYYTIYAHAEELHQKVGDRIKSGEAVGTVGDSGSLTGPGLHFEVRHHGKSVDPMKWFRKG